MVRWICAGILAGLIVCPAPVFAQFDAATAVGAVVDSQGAAAAGAKITARNVDTGFSIATTSDAEGRYRLAALLPGVYEFQAELQGFALTLRKGVTLAVGAEAVINLELKPASLSETVSVTAESPVIETTTASVQTGLNREAIDLLPVIGREYESLLRLVAGAQSSNGTSFTGSRGRANQWNVDGVDNSNDITGYSRQTPALDSIQEVQIIVNGFKAEYGSAAGGIINVVTRAGANTPRGSAFALFRNQDLMSRSPYADRSLPADPFQRFHYGGTFGGPIKRDRLHYFATYEREDRDTFSSSTRTLPSATANFAPSTRQYLASAGIDLSLFGAGGVVRQVRPEYIDTHRFSIRADNQATPNQLLTVRYSLEHETDPSGTSGTLYDYNGATTLTRHNFANINHKWILGSSLLNEAYGLVGQTFYDAYASQPAITNLSISGGFDLGASSDYPQGRTDYVYQVTDYFTWARPATRTGDHVVKAGAQLKIFRSDGFFDSNFRGTYTFPTLQRFIDGQPSRFTQQRGNSRLKRPNEIYGLYVQDDWRTSNSVTLNLGVRYDYEAAKTEALRDITGEPGPGISRDRNNWSPRVGFAWAPKGATGQAFYGGAGVYFDQVILNVQGNARFTPPKVISLQIDNPAWPNPFGSEVTPPPSISIIDPDLVTPWSWNSQVGYRRELTANLGLDVSYIHNRGHDQVMILNTNAGRPGTANVTGGGAIRPDPAYVNKSFYTNLGEIRYHGMLVDLKRRFSGRFQGDINYTLSRTRDNSFNFLSSIIVPERPDLNWGPGSDDRRHRVSGHVEVRLPWDVQLASIVQWRSESPLNVTAARDLNGDGSTGDWVNQAICRTIACPGFSFSRNGVYELSTETANQLRALLGLTPIDRFENNPKYFNTDLTLQKSVRLGGRRLRVTAEGFNLFNIPQRAYGSTSITSSLFGQYTSVDQVRAIQFTAQVDW